MKIEVKENTVIKRIIEVSFPIFRIHRVDSETKVYTKIESIDKEITIFVYNSQKIEVEIGKPNFYGDLDFLLAKKEFESNEKQFNNAKNKIANLLSII